MEYKSVSGFFDIFIGCWENLFWTWRVEYFPIFLALGSVKEVVLRISKESHTDWRIGKRVTLELSFSKIHQIFIRNRYAWSKGIKIKIELKFSARNGLALGSYIKAVSFDSLNFRRTSHWGFTPLKTLSTSKNTNFASFFAKLSRTLEKVQVKLYLNKVARSAERLVFIGALYKWYQVKNTNYYMASSVSGQDESNPAL